MTDTTPGTLSVTLPSGASFEVLNDEEAEYLAERVRRYLTDNTFSNVTDMQDLDGMLVLEMLRHRWTRWLGMRQDYVGKPIDEARLRADVGSLSRELRQLKKTLGLDKPTRDKVRGVGSVAQRWEALARRAKLMGIMRNEQAITAITGAMELIGIVTFSGNLPEDERRAMRMMPEDIVEWIKTVFQPRMEAIDRKFREEGPEAQKLWIGDQ